MRHVRLTAVAALVAALAFASTATAQTDPARDALCQAAAQSLASDSLLSIRAAVLPLITCARLASSVQGQLDNEAARALTGGSARARAALALDPRDLQPARGAVGAASGGGVTGLAPEPLVGGSVAAVDTEEGAGALATFSLNPLVLRHGLAANSALAAAARIVDLSLIVPIDDADRNGDGRLDYLGARIQINAAGAAEGQAHYDALLAAYAAAFDDVLRHAARETGHIKSLLLDADDPEACARGILTGTGVCADALTGSRAAELVARLDSASTAARAAADSVYFGLDARVDYGDPTLGTTPGADGIALTALVAYGVDLTPRTASLSADFRAHGGLYYANREAGSAHVAVEVAVGIGASRTFGLQQIEGHVGLVGRYGFAGDDLVEALDGDRLLLDGSLNVPITATQSGSVRLAFPLLGERSGPILSIGGNWHLPLPGRPGF